VWAREGCTTWRRQVGILQHLARLMGSECNGACGVGRGLGEGGSLVKIVFFM